MLSSNKYGFSWLNHQELQKPCIRQLVCVGLLINLYDWISNIYKEAFLKNDNEYSLLALLDQPEVNDLSWKLGTKGNLRIGILEYRVLAVSHQYFGRAITNKFLQNYELIERSIDKPRKTLYENIIIESPESFWVNNIHSVCLEINEIINWLVS